MVLAQHKKLIALYSWCFRIYTQTFECLGCWPLGRTYWLEIANLDTNDHCSRMKTFLSDWTKWKSLDECQRQTFQSLKDSPLLFKNPLPFVLFLDVIWLLFRFLCTHWPPRNFAAVTGSLSYFSRFGINLDKKHDYQRHRLAKSSRDLVTFE